MQTAGQGNAVVRYITTFVGMTFFWTFFRTPTVFGVLFPVNANVFFGNVPIRLYLVFLAMVFVLGCIAMVYSHRLKTLFTQHRTSVLALIACGVVGSWMRITEINELANGTAWVSSLFVAVGFVFISLAWAYRFSERFGATELILLAGSYLASLIIFNLIGLHVPHIKQVLVVVIPLLTGTMWYVSGEIRPLDDVVMEKPDLTSKLYIALFAVFLLIGSVLRGIVDFSNPIVDAPYLRWTLSLTITAIILMYFVSYAKFRKRRLPELERLSPESRMLKRFRSVQYVMLVCWMALSLVFFAGIFAFSVLGQHSLGGHVVVAARSLLDLVLWMFLCNVASNRKVNPIKLFVTTSILIEIISWATSYITHALLANGTIAIGAQVDSLVQALAFLLAAVVIIILCILLRNKQLENNYETLEPAVPEEPLDIVPPALIEHYGLTSREVEVIRLFSQGYSLNKVADALCISKSTAQTHVKSAYRKLEIHSKDELIDLMSSWKNCHA